LRSERRTISRRDVSAVAGSPFPSMIRVRAFGWIDLGHRAAPPSSPDDHGSDDLEHHAGEKTARAISGDEKHFGDGAFWLRTYLTEQPRAQYVEQPPRRMVRRARDRQGRLGNMKEGQRRSRTRRTPTRSRRSARQLVVPLSPIDARVHARATREAHASGAPRADGTEPQNRTMRITAPAVPMGRAPARRRERRRVRPARSSGVRRSKDPRTVVVKRSVVFVSTSSPSTSTRRGATARIDALWPSIVRALKAGGK
jgi:hypothetical protein